MANLEAYNNENAVKQQVLKATSIVEQQLDAEIEKLGQLDDAALDRLRLERLSQMKEKSKQKQEWLKSGHGTYEELPEESEFFKVIKNSKNVVIHFYRNETPRYKIFDHHLKILAPKHLETHFVKLDAERCPFLAERLNIKVLPMLMISIDGKVKDRIIGFTDLGNRDDFTTDVLEWRIALSNVIEYDGDLLSNPMEKNSKGFKKPSKHTIRDSGNNSDSDSDDFS